MKGALKACSAVWGGLQEWMLTLRDRGEIQAQVLVCWLLSKWLSQGEMICLPNGRGFCELAPISHLVLIVGFV